MMTEHVRTQNVRQMTALLRKKDPDLMCTVTFPLEAGALVRRNIRVWLDRAEAAGVEVKRREQKGLLSSDFTITLQGRSAQVADVCDNLAELIGVLEE